MSRGRQLKSKTKEAYHTSKRAEAGRLEAQLEYHRKTPLIDRASMLLELAGKRLAENPTETMCLGALTYLVYSSSIDDTIAKAIGVDTASVQNEPAKLALSYVIAYIITHFAGQLIGLTGDVFASIADLGKWLIISKAVGPGTGSKGVAFWTAAGGALPLVTLMPWGKEAQNWWDNLLKYGKSSFKMP